MIYFLAEIVTSFLESYIFCSASSLVFQKKIAWYIKFLISSILTMVVLYLNSYIYFSVFTMLVAPVVWGITAAVVFKVKIRYTISLSFFYILIIFIVDSIVLSVMGIITRQPDYVALITQTGRERLVFILVDKLVFLCFYLLIRKAIKKRADISESKYLLFISLGGLCGGFYLAEQMASQVNVDIAVSWVLLLIVVALMLIVVHFYIKQQQEKDALEFTAMRNELLETNYNNLKELYETNSKLFHDFKNHIRVINRLVNENNMEDLKEYVAGFELKDRQGDHTIWTEDTVVNFILNNKIGLGKRMGIRINANIDLPLKTNIRSSDMTTIFANLFDNAIEACNRVPNGNEKMIDVAVRKINGMLIVKFENSCYEKPVKKENSFLTIKENKNFHGWGLKSVESTAKEYSGSLDCSYDQEKRIFKTVLNLSFKDFDAVN